MSGRSGSASSENSGGPARPAPADRPRKRGRRHGLLAPAALVGRRLVVITHGWPRPSPGQKARRSSPGVGGAGRPVSTTRPLGTRRRGRCGRRRTRIPQQPSASGALIPSGMPGAGALQSPRNLDAPTGAPVSGIAGRKGPDQTAGALPATAMVCGAGPDQGRLGMMDLVQGRRPIRPSPLHAVEPAARTRSLVDIGSHPTAALRVALALVHRFVRAGPVRGLGTGKGGDRCPAVGSTGGGGPVASPASSAPSPAGAQAAAEGGQVEACEGAVAPSNGGGASRWNIMKKQQSTRGVPRTRAFPSYGMGAGNQADRGPGRRFMGRPRRSAGTATGQAGGRGGLLAQSGQDQGPEAYPRSAGTGALISSGRDGKASSSASLSLAISVRRKKGQGGRIAWPPRRCRIGSRMVALAIAEGCQMPSEPDLDALGS